MKTLNGKNVALSLTLEAYPDSEHARETLLRVETLMPGCRILDSFICQGAMDPKLQEWMSKLPSDHPHAVDEKRLKRWEDASSHPDEEDCGKAGEWAKGGLWHI